MTDPRDDAELHPADVDPAELGDTPDLDVVYERERYEQGEPVAVCLAEPATVDVLPTRWGGSRRWNLAYAAGPPVVAAPVRIYGEDERRAAITFFVVSGAVVFGESQAEVDPETGKAGALTPAAGAVRLPLTGQVWARADAADTVLSTFVEQWSR